MLSGARLSSDVLSMCLGHALTNEKEEIMGLLIGAVEVCAVLSCVVLC